LYEAATQPEMWKIFLEKASEVLQADKAAVLVYSPDHGRAAVCVDLGFTEELRRDAEQMTKYHPWIAEIQKHRGVGWYSGSIENTLCMEAFRKSKFYSEARRHQIEWVGAAAVFTPE